MNPSQRAVQGDPEAVRAMFDRVARRYDLANHLLSAGRDFAWRRRAAGIVAGWTPRDVLDVATGTGDLALLMQRRFPDAAITGCDFSSGMLAIAKRKGVMQTSIADASKLPFADHGFDVVTIAFGLRNVADRGSALQEFARVLRPGGYLLVLDFSMPRTGIRRAYRLYLHHVLPLFAGVLTGERAAYDYLAQSIEEFPSGEPMCDFINANCFRNAVAEPLTSGVVTIYTATTATASEPRPGA